jgi:hypothetical protein
MSLRPARRGGFANTRMGNKGFQPHPVKSAPPVLLKGLGTADMVLSRIVPSHF